MLSLLDLLVVPVDGYLNEDDLAMALSLAVWGMKGSHRRGKGRSEDGAEAGG